MSPFTLSGRPIQDYSYIVGSAKKTITGFQGSITSERNGAWSIRAADIPADTTPDDADPMIATVLGTAQGDDVLMQCGRNTAGTILYLTAPHNASEGTVTSILGVRNPTTGSRAARAAVPPPGEGDDA